MATAKSKPQKPAKTPTTDPAELITQARNIAFKDDHPERAFMHFRPLAEKVPVADVKVFTGNPLIMRANVVHALEAVGPHLPAAIQRLADAPLQDVFELPSLIMGLDYTVSRVPVTKLSAREIESMLDEGSPWRELMLTYLEVVSHPLLNLVPNERVRAIRAGKGKLDMARDFVSIPGVFNEFKTSLAGKHPFPEDKLERLGTLGTALVQQVRPGRAHGEAAKRSEESILRDQFAALVEDRYDAL